VNCATAGLRNRELRDLKGVTWTSVLELRKCGSGRSRRETYRLYAVQVPQFKYRSSSPAFQVPKFSVAKFSVALLGVGGPPLPNCPPITEFRAMRLLVLGASGGCGRWVTRLAASAGHEVTALVRPGTSFQPPVGVRVERGSALDVESLSRVVAGQAAVISCIGPQRMQPHNPWSPLRAPLRVAELSARAATRALQAAGIGRFAAISAAGVGDSFRFANPMIRWLIRSSTIGAMYADLDAMEKVLHESSLDWLAVRPVTLVNFPPSKRTKVLTHFRTASIVGRADVAGWLLRAALDPAPIAERTPMIGWW
jgi:uncharacterized protein YbjT (DUF2867 family)